MSDVSSPEVIAPPTIPPLREGDRLTREEFERRYDAMPELKKAELIDGVVYMGSPVRHRRHSRPHARLIGWLAIYEFATEAVEIGDNASARLTPLDEPQADATMFILPECGGQVRISRDDYIEQAAELMAEIAGSSKGLDSGKKRDLYAKVGVREYIVWRTEDEAIDWFILRDDRYQRLIPGPDGVLRSEVFPGLWLDAHAMLAGDRKRVSEGARQGIASPEHSAFVQRLSAARSSS